MDVFLQSLLLAGIGVCVWLAFHPSSREDYDDIERPRRLSPPVPATGPTDVRARYGVPPAPRRPLDDAVSATEPPADGV